MKHVTFHLPSFLRRVRIHGGEFDSSARAMNREEQVRLLQADLRIVRGSTIERKHMSTTIKRIALVAVAAMGFGVLSVVPSSALPTNVTLTTVAGTSTLAGGASDSRTAATLNLTAVLGAADSITVQIFTKSVPAGGSTDARFINLDSATATNTSQKLYQSASAASNSTTAWPVNETATGGFVLGSASATNVNWKFGVQLESATAGRVAGTYVFTVLARSFDAGTAGATVAQDVTITIAAAAAAKAAVASAATAYIQAGNGNAFGAGVVADSATSGSFVPGTVIGEINVKNQSSAGVLAVDTITVSMAGPGSLSDGTTTGRSFTVANVETRTFDIIADGVSGEATITITTGVGASFTKKAVFFDTKPAKATATVAKAFIKAGTTAVDDVFAIVVTDTLGNAIKDTGAVVTAAATDTATTVGGAATCAWNVKGDAYHCSVAGKAADKFGPVAYTITATGTGINALTKVTTSATVTFSDVVATKAVLAGPATGTPGATVEYTLTLTEKNGYPVADQTYGVAAAGGVLFSATAADTVASGWSGTDVPFTASDSYTSKSGVITAKGKLPIAGTASLSLTLVGDGLQTLAVNAIDKVIGKTKLSVSTEITNPGVDAATDAANEATDAANAATDAALAAAEAADAATTAAQEASDAVAALSESVTKLIAGLQAQIKSLAAVVAKIAKKVKA
jgi:trimeric autotransporter adhesin